MARFAQFCVALLLVAGCSQSPEHPAPSRVETYSVDEATMVDFYKRTGRIDAQLEPRVPPAMALKPLAEDDKRLAVVIWTPEKVMKSLGIRDRDRIVMIDDEEVGELFGDTWKEVGYKKVGVFGTRKYTHFVNRLFARRQKADVVELLVYRPKSDTPDVPFAIRIEFTD